MTDLILVERRGHVAIVTLNDPSTRNAISDLAMIDAFVAAFEAIDRDTSVRAVVLTGAGRAPRGPSTFDSIARLVAASSVPVTGSELRIWKRRTACVVSSEGLPSAWP